MTEEKVKLITGSLLHDIGKVIYRQGTDRRNHSTAGGDYLKDEVGITDRVVLDCVKYHHAAMLKGAALDDNSLAYIVYLADNIAAFADRRKKAESDEKGFELAVPLQSIFNILNGNHEEFYYQPGDMGDDNGINYPSAEKKKFSEAFYTKIRQRLTDNLKGLQWTEEYINSLMAVMEANLTYIPSSTAKSELADISLYDHVKLTAAIAACIYDYLKEKGLSYKAALFEHEKSFYDERAFILYSMDVSGIQNFIYTIASKNALKTLRARSFYLEIMMEHIIDLFLEEAELSRANLIYSGGGHCYILLPNTEKTIAHIQDFQQEMKQWFLENYQTELYVATGYAACTANALRNMPDGSYSEIYRKLSMMISKQKQHRYEAADILWLNGRKMDDYTRECKVCKNIGHVNKEGVCRTCQKISDLSKNILYDKFFGVVKDETKEKGLPLLGGYSLIACHDEKDVRKKFMSDDALVRIYGKNALYTGKNIATKLWVGDYNTGDTFEQLAESAEGIKRIAVLRADVDNLGQAIVSGFDGKVSGLSRTATLSRHLSIFFKYFIRDILEHSEYSLSGETKVHRRNAAIIYSGGDDVFIVGAWNEVIELAVDLRNKFKRYTQGTLSLSAGIGMYGASYPIAVIAGETGAMEDRSKHLPGKDAVTLLEDGESHEMIVDNKRKSISDGTYQWDCFEDKVVAEKYRTLADFFDTTEKRGKNFLYKILELIRQQERMMKGEGDKIGFARLVYLLTRLEPTKDGEEKEAYRHFSKCMYQWIQSPEDCRQLKTAINLYAYMNRERGEGTDENNK